MRRTLSINGLGQISRLNKPCTLTTSVMKNAGPALPTGSETSRCSRSKQGAWMGRVFVEFRIDIVRTLVVAAVMLGGLAAPVWAGFDEGMAAHRRGDYAAALQEWRPLAERGSVKAQNGLGDLYRRGDGVPQDYAAAARWYLKAAEQGYAKAQNNLGDMYAAGLGVAKDLAQAMRWWRRAAERGDAADQYILGALYADGEEVPQDWAEAARWYRKSAEQGYAKAQSSLGLMYSKGQGVPQNFIEAHKWYNLSAMQGNEIARKNRDILAQRMIPADVSKAQGLAREWWARRGKKN
jgi:TPR repeat protein